VSDVIQVRLKKGEDVGRALKRMKKILDKEGLMKQLRANRYFEKPSEKQRRKSARARARARARRNANP
jgi:small subunit ribosomal protein S21